MPRPFVLEDVAQLLNMGLTRLKLAGGVLVVTALFSLAGDWYMGDLSVRLYAVEADLAGAGPPAAAPARVSVSFSAELARAATNAALGQRVGQSRALLDARRRHLDDLLALGDTDNRMAAYKPVGSATQEQSELDRVLTRIDRCLSSTNMSSYFHEMNLYEGAREDARALLSSIRQIVPKFKVPYTVPCWDTRFVAKREFYRGSLIKGSVGDFNFTYNSRILHSQNERKIFKGVRWLRSPRNMYIEQSSACLPKIFLLGYPKCGSTFLYCLLHCVLRYSVGITGRSEAAKEPHWWVIPGPRNREQSLKPDYLAVYLLNFHRATSMRDHNMPAVTIDASPNLMFQWPRYSRTESLENYCLIPSLVPVVLPDSKYFVIMRNPVSMLYSAFWFSCTTLGYKLDSVKYRGPDIFHERVTAKIEIFNECKNRGMPLDLCVDEVAPNIYSSELPLCGRTRLEMGLYYFHARRWLSVLPRSRIHFFTLEEIATQDLSVTAEVIIDFLELPKPTSRVVLDEDAQCNENPQSVVDYKNDPRLQIRTDTREILEEFFRPYNQMLADLLGDNKFLFGSHT